jgi:cytochrome c peroxidase
MNVFLSRATHMAAPAAAATVVLFSANFPSDVYAKSSSLSDVEAKAVKSSIAKLINSDLEARGDGTSLIGTFVRLAWHCAGTFSKADKSGGSNGARMRFNPEANWGANAGLDTARKALEPIKAKYPNITYADLYTLAGVVAVEESGGPTIPFRLGREDMDSGETSPPDGRLPDADKGSKIKTICHIRDVFYRMGVDDREIVALLGAHALGRCHTDASGYWGPWTFAENTFSNEYFRLLLEERWSPKLTHNGQLWDGPDQYEDSTGQLMMLPSDIALVQDPSLRKIVELYAKDEDAFFKDFAKAFAKLLELGVPFPAVKSWWQFW